MDNFTASRRLQEEHLSALRSQVQAELVHALSDATKGLKARKVVFDDGMGSVTVDITCRRGGEFVVATWDQYHSKSKNMYSPPLRRLPTVKRIAEILDQYEEFFTQVSVGTLVIWGGE